MSHARCPVTRKLRYRREASANRVLGAIWSSTQGAGRVTGLPRCHADACNLLAAYTTVQAVGRYGDHLAWTTAPTCWQHGDSEAIELARALDRLDIHDEEDAT